MTLDLEGAILLGFCNFLKELYTKEYIANTMFASILWDEISILKKVTD
jgi:hypothetical protein